MWTLLKEKLVEVLQAVVPLMVVVTVLLVALTDSPMSHLPRFFVGSVLVVLGMAVLFIGLELGVMPMGRFIGAGLPKKGSIMLIVGVAFALGFATTVAEPDVLVLSQQVDEASGGTVNGDKVMYVIALGVAFFVAIAMARIIYGFPLTWLLAATYAAMLLLSFVVPGQFVPLAYDAGSVTTGVLTTPVVIALAIGLSSVLAGRSPATDGFGLLGVASMGAIIAVLLLGMWQ